MVDEAHGEVKLALQELRDLARGIHPAVLTDRGLDAALSVGRLPLHGAGEGDRGPAGSGRPRPSRASPTSPSPSCCRTSASTAGRRAASVDVWRADDRLLIQVRDDGRGGARLDGGTGMAGLAERLGAVDGLFVLDSPAGGPTTVTAELPWRDRGEPRGALTAIGARGVRERPGGVGVRAQGPDVRRRRVGKTPGPRRLTGPMVRGPAAAAGRAGWTPTDEPRPTRRADGRRRWPRTTDRSTDSAATGVGPRDGDRAPGGVSVAGGAARAVRGAHLAGVRLSAAEPADQHRAASPSPSRCVSLGAGLLDHLPRDSGAGRRAGRLPGLGALERARARGLLGLEVGDPEPVRAAEARADGLGGRGPQERGVLAAPALRAAALPVGGLRLRRLGDLLGVRLGAAARIRCGSGSSRAYVGQAGHPALRRQRRHQLYLDTPFEIGVDRAGRPGARPGHAVDDPRR